MIRRTLAAISAQLKQSRPNAYGQILLCIVLGVFSLNAYAINPLATKVGAIRWDGWVGAAPTPGVGADYVGLQMERALGPHRYHDRLPFFAAEAGWDSVEVRMDSQAKMDAEITYAQNAGLDFWAFDYYVDGSGQETARHYYEASSARTTLNFAFILGVNSHDPATIVADFQKPYYQKVLGNRPLVFLFTYAETPYTAADVQQLRQLSAAAGLGDPYVVILNFDPNSAATWASDLDAQAVSAYATPHGSGPRPPRHAYSQLTSLERNKWDQYNWASWQINKKIVPWVTTGWDPRPMIDNPPTWGSPYPPQQWTETATPSEIAQHLQSAIDWQNVHWQESEANVILMYAWNEHAEGGWIVPTLWYGADRLNAINGVLRDKPPADPNQRNVYRFRHDYPYVDRFFTLNYGEGIYAGYVQEGIGFVTFINPDASMHQLYRCNSGYHFVSVDPNCEGFSNEGSYGYVSSIARQGFTALYRFQRGYEHLATKNYAEGSGWNYEGILGYVPN